MPLNQQVTEGIMSDQPVVEKLHIQTLINSDPDFLEENDKLNLNDLIEQQIKVLQGKTPINPLPYSKPIENIAIRSEENPNKYNRKFIQIWN